MRQVKALEGGRLLAGNCCIHSAFGKEMLQHKGSFIFVRIELYFKEMITQTFESLQESIYLSSYLLDTRTYFAHGPTLK